MRDGVVHYHGTPIWGETGEVLKVAIKGGGAFVSYVRPDQLKLCLRYSKDIKLDNGAFSAWKSGVALNWTDFYKWLMGFYFNPKVSGFLIPDVICGTEAQNDELIRTVPTMFRGKAVPVWHLHESLGRLVSLCRIFKSIALGSSGEYAVTRTKAWHGRMTLALAIVGTLDLGTKVHGCRMLDGRILGNYPLDTADSTNLACNVPKTDKKYPNLGTDKIYRCAVLRAAIENVTPPKMADWVKTVCPVVLSQARHEIKAFNYGYPYF